MTPNQTIKHYPLSSPQLDFWFDQILHPDVPLYNIGGYVRIEGPIDPALFEKALNQVIAENDALRIILHEGESLPTQTFAENVHIKLDFYDFSEKENAHELALKWMSEEFVKPFQLYDGLLFQFALCKAEANCYYWLKKYHHLIVDGWGISLIVQRVAAAYNALVSGQTGEQKNYAYPDFIQNDQAYFESTKFVKAKRYWQEKYRQVPEPLMVRRYAAQFQGKTIPSQRATLRLKRPFYNQLIDFAEENKVSTFHVVLGALYCYFVRTCHREDLVIGLLTLNRNSAAFKKTVGMFTSASPAWFRFGTDLNFVELVEKISKELQRDYRYQRLPYREINRQVGLHQALFDLTLSYGKQDFDTYFNGNSTRSVYFTNGFTQNALAIFIEEFHQHDDVNIYFDYNLGFFDADEIERLKARFEFLLGEILRQPSVPVRALQIMSNVELNKIVVEFNNTATDYPRDKTLINLFEEQVAKTPEAIAVVFSSTSSGQDENQQLTYRELNTQANQLAHYLQTLGVKPEILVGICVERSIKMVIGLLGILKAGGAYLPLDPTYPAERLAFMLEDSFVKVLLTQSSLLDGLPKTEVQVICLDVEAKALSRLSSENPVSGVTSTNLAYVIYTSGSTGEPKGVMNTHRGICNRLLWMQEAYQLLATDNVLQKTPFSFDVSVWEFFWPLLVGARLIVAKPEGHKDSHYLVKLIVQQNITTLHFVPSMLQVFVQEQGLENCHSLKRVICSGEALPFELQERFFARLSTVELHNLYGPTEAAVDVTYWQCQRENQNLNKVPIGRPIANIQIYILDQYLQPVPIGISGELHIGGVGLARGYLNRPKLTAEKFINNPFDDEPNSRLYKTGDLARYLPDGNIEYLGRIDNQVKIRGFRIELSEIEAVLATHPFVKENAVIVHEASETDKRLVAYVVPYKGQVIENTALRSFLTERLPDYMIPSAFVTLDTLPLTPNGKIDRRALVGWVELRYTHLFQVSEKTFVAPRTPNEKSLADIWAEVLGGEPVGIHDSFFELGGHSLLATQVISRLRDRFGVEVPLRELFEFSTIAELVQQIEMNREREPNDQLVQTIQPISRQQKLPLSYFQEQLWFLVQVNPDIPFYNESTAIHINGTLDVAALEQSFNEIIKRHEILRTTFVIKDGQPVQNIITLPPTLKLPIVDLRTVPEEQREAKAIQLANEHAKPLFDFTQVPLVRAILVQMDEAQFRLFATAHHIIADGFCLYNIFMQELVTFYKAFSTGESLPLPKLPIQYADFASWQRQQTFEEQLSYWKSILSDNPPMLQLPTDQPRPVKPTFRGAKQNFTLSQSLTTKLKQLNQQEGVTLFMTLLATFNTLLYRYSGQDDMVIGSFADCHNRPELENVMGYFVNTLVLRTDMSGKPTFKQLLARVREVTLGAYSHHDLPFKKLVEVLNPARNANQNPFFEVALTLEPPVMSALDSDLDWKLYQYDDGIDTDTARFDLSIEFEERAFEIIGRIEYSTELFKAATIERMIGHFLTLLEGIVANPQQRISELPLLTSLERHQLVEWNDTQADYPKDKCIHQLFEAQVETTPDAVAVVFEDQQLTYRELNTKANQLAHYLQTLGVKPEVLVGICVERSIKMVIGLFGILKAGGAYVPLDPTYPIERLAFMLEDAPVLVLLTQSNLKEKLPETQVLVVCLDVEIETLSQLSSENIKSEVGPENLAYVIYTSGSTGKPKGTLIIHQGLINYLSWSIERYQVASGLGAPVHSPLGFDATITSLFLPLLVGQRILLLPVSSEPDAILTAIQSGQNWSFVKLTPAHLEILNTLLPKQELLGKTRFLILGGDALFGSSLSFWRTSVPETRIINEYGPTETVVGCCVYEIDANTPREGAVPIGRPIANTQLYILDKFLQRLPIGVLGELHIGGAGVARGYLNRSELTAEKFISNPFSDEPNSRMYKTGDLARYLPDGNIEYLGRIDNQVKIRGFRIELGEIEALLSQHPLVKTTVVTVDEVQPNEKRLIAYLVSDLDESHQTLDDSLQSAQIETISQWENLFEDSYNQSAPNQEQTLNLAGWNSSYTGLAIPTEEMREWVDSTVNAIMSLQPNRVLEIGCGTGLLLSRIAPHCRQYWGTDFSSVVLQQVEQLKRTVSNLEHVRLLNRKADDFIDIKPEIFDTVIINSVIQYFPNVAYLVKVLDKAIKVVKSGGYIFIGDIRSLPLLTAYHASVQLYKAPNSLSRLELQQRVQQYLAQEEELLIDPAFFLALQSYNPRVKQVKIQPHRGHFHNELTRFRYEVILKIGEEVKETANIQWIDWSTQPLSLSTFRQQLIETETKLMGIRGVPNARLETENETLQWLLNAKPTDTVGQLRAFLSKRKPVGIDPEYLWKLRDELPFEIEISWANANTEGSYDVLFKHRTQSVQKTFFLFPVAISSLKPWHHYANNPLKNRLNQQLVPQLRQFLTAQLPEYMVPSRFIMLEALPLTPNGKVDRNALPAPDKLRSTETGFVEPRDILESQLAQIWAKVLDVYPIGVQDNFFDLGGHSLLAVRLMADIQQQFGKNLSIATLFQGATIEQLAKLIRQQTDSQSWSPLVAIQPHGSKPPFFCVPGTGGNVLYFHQLARHLGQDQPFYGLQAVGLDGETAPETKVEDMAARYIQEIQTIQPQGPYLLGGHSFGGWVALEMAKQLQLKGQKVARLAIFDTTVPFNQPIGIDWDDAQWITDVAHIVGRLLGRELEVSYAEFQQLETQAQFRYLHEILEQNGWLISIKQLQALVTIFKANCQTDYVPQAIEAIPISLFKASDIPLQSQASAQMETFSQHLKQETSWGWHQYASGSVDIHVVPGDHHTMMSQPHVQILAERLKKCLDKV